VVLVIPAIARITRKARRQTAGRIRQGEGLAKILERRELRSRGRQIERRWNDVRVDRVCDCSEPFVVRDRESRRNGDVHGGASHGVEQLRGQTRSPKRRNAHVRVDDELNEVARKAVLGGNGGDIGRRQGSDRRAPARRIDRRCNDAVLGARDSSHVADDEIDFDALRDVAHQFGVRLFGSS